MRVATLAQQQAREKDGQGITTASRHPFGRILEIDLHYGLLAEFGRRTDRSVRFSASGDR